MKNRSRQIIFSTIIGNALEWYDYLLYAHFAVVISKIFFPLANTHYSLMLTLAVFAVGFLGRPLGGYIFGKIGDEIGRKTALSVSILLMAVPTAIIGILPGYDKMGVLAPILILIMRLLQGISLGGEYSSSTTYLVESAPRNRKALFGSLSSMSLAIGVLVSSLSVFAIENYFTPDEVIEYAWRIPFLASIIFGFIGFYIRSTLHESEEFLNAKKEGNLTKKPFIEIIKHHKANLATAIGIFMSLTIPFYVIVVFSKTILVMTGFDAKLATLLNIILVAVYMITTPISGFLSDKVSEKMILMASVLLTLFFIYPFMAIIQSNELYLIIPAFVVAGILIGFYQGAVPSFSAKCFDVKVRASGVSLAYNLPAIVFGGTAPMIVNAIMNSSGKIIPVAYYVMFGCLCTISALIYSFLKDSK